MYSKLLENNVILDGHWILTSGNHSKLYINKDKIYSNPFLFQEVIFEISQRIKNINYDIITGPAIAGAVLAAPISLNKMGTTFVYPEKIISNDKNGIPITKMEFRRGYDKIIAGNRVMIIEDIITTGNSVQKVITAVTDPVVNDGASN